MSSTMPTLLVPPRQIRSSPAARRRRALPFVGTRAPAEDAQALVEARALFQRCCKLCRQR